MNYAEIKQNLISLGFAEESDYEEYEELGYTYDAINRAISEIGSIFPYIAKYEFEIDDTDDGYIYLDMSDRDGFLSFAETPVLFEQSGTEMFKRFGDYQIEMERTLVIDASKNKGSFRVYYNKNCTQINENTSDAFVPELPLKVHHLIPLLAAYYLWLDDENDKAMLYYQQFRTELDAILSKENAPRMRVAVEWGRNYNDWYTGAAANDITNDKRW